MRSVRIIEVTDKDVPLPVIFKGRDGQVVVYELKPGSRKFGLSLQKASDWVRDRLLPKK